MKKRRILGLLLALGMILGMSVMASAETHTSLQVGDVIKEGDTISFTQDTNLWGSDWSKRQTCYANTPLVLIRIEDPNGSYYGFKFVNGVIKTDFYKTIPATKNSKGVLVKEKKTDTIGNNSYPTYKLEAHEIESFYEGNVYKTGDTFRVYSGYSYKFNGTNQSFGYNPVFTIGEYSYNGSAWVVPIKNTNSNDSSFNIVLSGDNQKSDKPPLGFRVINKGTSEDPYIFEAVYQGNHIHNYSSTWNKDENKHWHECTSTTGTCDAPRKDEAAHTYGTSGNARFTCSVCKYENSTLKAEAEAADKKAAPKTAVEQPTSQEKITILKAPVLKKLRSKKNKVQVTWNKIRKNKAGKKLIKQIKYIEIQAARDLEFQNIVATKNVGKKKTKATLKLARKTTYYVRVRYVGTDGVSKWSKIKKVKTK